MNRQISIYRQGFALAFGLFIYLLCVFTLEKTGVPRVYSIALTASGLMVLWIIAAAWGGTTRSTKYFHADRAVRSTVNSLAMTSILAFPVITATGGGLLYGNPAFLIAMVIIAASVSLRFVRSGQAGRLILGGILSGFVLYAAARLVTSLGSNGIVPPFVAAWSPSLVAILFGMSILLYQEDG